jgi:hypothetical protein
MRDKYDDIRWAENEFSVARAIDANRKRRSRRLERDRSETPTPEVEDDRKRYDEYVNCGPWGDGE